MVIHFFERGGWARWTFGLILRTSSYILMLFVTVTGKTGLGAIFLGALTGETISDLPASVLLLDMQNKQEISPEIICSDEGKHFVITARKGHFYLP